jgi:hypothetical protein
MASGRVGLQGELYPLYIEKLTKIMSALRRELNAEDVPLVVGGLGDFLRDCEHHAWLANYTQVNKALKSFAEQTPNTAFASAEGLTSNPDKLHFDHSSLVEFGTRYYEAFETLANREPGFDRAAKNEDLARTDMELL